MKGEKSHDGVNLDPEYAGAVRWAWASAKQWRAKWWLGGVLFGIVGTVSGFIIPGSWGNKLELSLMAFAIAVAIVTLISLVFALLSAPHQQRNALRDRIAKERLLEAGDIQGQPESPARDISQQARADDGSTIVQAGRDAIQAGRDVHYTNPQANSGESNG
jgi:hypothetical protein